MFAEEERCRLRVLEQRLPIEMAVRMYVLVGNWFSNEPQCLLVNFAPNVAFLQNVICDNAKRS